MLQLQDVVFEYRQGVPVLDGLNMSVRSGEAVALVGENGAGKTTVTRLATALEHPVSGTVRVNGRLTENLNPEDLSSSVAYVFQHVDRQLFARRVVDEVAFAARYRGATEKGSRDMAMRNLTLVGLADEAETHPLDLSPAGRKLVGLASALAQDPELIILDEPTQGLDLDHVLMIAAVVRDTVAIGKSVLAVTHDVTFVAECLDRVVQISGGVVANDVAVSDALAGEKRAAQFGLRVPPVAALAAALRLNGRPIRFEDAVDALRNVAANQRRG